MKRPPLGQILEKANRLGILSDALEILWDIVQGRHADAARKADRAAKAAAAKTLIDRMT